MAKKKTQISMVLDAKFKIAVPEDKKANLFSEISDGKACLSVSMTYEDGVDFMISIYNDHFKEGGMSISSLDKEFAQVVVNGKIVRDLDPSFDADFIASLKNMGSIKINCSDVCDNDVNSYYIDGNDEIHLCIGECSLIG